MEKRYDFMQTEKQMQELWDKEKVYRFNKNAPGEIYSIDTPPLNVSGDLHIGHLFSYTQAEMIARFRRMQGYNVFYPFGYDDNGLPTERLVEREEDIRAHAVPRSQFIEKCLNVTEKYKHRFREFWQTLGFSADWETEYQTISDSTRKISQELFLELVKMGKAYTKESPVLWCTECRTSIAQAEVETKDVSGSFNYIHFHIDGDTVEVATTRPELLYGCVCLFVNPSDERYKQYIGKLATVPLYNYQVPVMADEKVAIEKGTGVVMCCTFGDAVDMQWYIQYNLPYKKIILPDGKIAEDVPFIGGMRILPAQKEIVRILGEQGLLVKFEPIVHAVGTHERCGKPSEIIPSRQWYIDILSERERYLQAANEINWYPQSMKSRYIAWVENLKWDWCISRQRYFGVPFPVWYCNECDKAAFAKEPQLPVNPMETTYQGVCECGNATFTPESAVLDTWATSSVTPQINERHGVKFTPMSMRTQAHEIIRTWTFYTIVRSLYHTGSIPWKDIMICGFVLAEKGEKLGKSKHNSILDPRNLVATHSADVLRYWTATARLGTDTFFSVDDLSISKRFITKMWNAYKFCIPHLQDIDLTQTPEFMPVDEWITQRANETTQNVARLLSQYEIGMARHEIDEFFWKDFCDNYIEIVKERLYRPDIHGENERRSGQHALYYVALNILKLYAPYVPHITERIYQEFFRQHEGEVSIHLMHWAKPSVINSAILDFGKQLKENIFEMRKYKSERNISMASEIDVLEIRTQKQYQHWFEQTEKDIIACSRAAAIKYIV
ncbi:MAG: valine--tRNA ligase [Defluviitaleaceae bacterium]|nr:valine--tRNA ligase [Defluviitaleaceae bacterium]